MFTLKFPEENMKFDVNSFFRSVKRPPYLARSRKLLSNLFGVEQLQYLFFLQSRWQHLKEKTWDRWFCQSSHITSRSGTYGPSTVSMLSQGSNMQFWSNLKNWFVLMFFIRKPWNCQTCWVYIFLIHLIQL